MKYPKNYWDFLVEDKSLYQMGAQSHRLFLLDLLKKEKVRSILDVGCGTGPIYELIFNSDFEGRWDFKKYKGTDYSEGMIESCRYNFPKGDFEVQDARRLKEANDSWDCVLLMHCLDHLDDYESAINEAARVAKKYVLIVLWRGLSASDENNLNDKSSYGRDDGGLWEDTHLQDYSESKLKQAFREAGLSIIVQTSGEEINKEGRFNTLFLLEKNLDKYGSI